MKQRLQEFIQEHNLLHPGQLVIVGYSGGADSTCLMHLLVDCGYQVIAAHLNHSQRIEADEQESQCENFAKSVGTDFVSGKADVPAIAKQLGIGIEEAGREARYEFFQQLHHRFHAPIATAHTLDDSIETVFLNLARGTGLRGLTGIPIKRDYIIRPLLFARRVETKRYCDRNKLWTLEDTFNFDERFARVRARQHLIPAFESLHSQSVENLKRFMEIAAEEDTLLNAISIQSLKNCETPSHTELDFLVSDAEVRFDNNKIVHVPNSLIKRGFSLIVNELGGAAEFSHLQDCISAIRDKRQCSVTFEEGTVVAEITSATTVLRKLEDTPALKFNLSIPGAVKSKHFNWKITCAFTDESPEPSSREMSVVCDRDAIQGELTVRRFKSGDRIQPFGAHQTKKVQDVLTDAKISKTLKARLPLVCDELGVIWIPGVCLSERMRVTPETKQRVQLKLEPFLAD